MYCRAPRVLLPCPTSPTPVPHESYTRALRVLHPSEYKIVTLRLSYINCLFILAFEIFSNTSFLFCSIQCMFADGHTIICSYLVWTGAMNRSPTPTECTLRLFTRQRTYPLQQTLCNILLNIFSLKSLTNYYSLMRNAFGLILFNP